MLQKHQDAFASAFGFFLLGYDLISNYSTPQEIPQQFFGITDPVLWFFKVGVCVCVCVRGGGGGGTGRWLADIAITLV